MKLKNIFMILFWIQFFASISIRAEEEAQEVYEPYGRNTPQENVELAVGGLSGIITKLIKGPKKRQLPQNSSAEKVYIYLANMFSEEIEKTVKAVLPKIYDYGYTINDLLSEKCFTAAAQFGDRARNGEPWALKMIDSSAKFLPTSIMDGTFIDIGNFDQCLRIKATKGVEDGKQFLYNGKYCLIKFKMPLPPRKNHLKYTDKFFNFKNTTLENGGVEYISSLSHSLYANPFLVGVCVPSVCEANDIQVFFHNFLQKFHFEVEVGMDCYSEDNKPNLLDPNEYMFSQIISIAVIGFMSTVVGFATLYELYIIFIREDTLKTNNKTPQSPILCLSAYSNFRNLLSMKSQNKNIQSVNGIKVIAILWIVIGNVYLLGYQPQLKSFIKSVHSEMSLRGGTFMFQFILNSWTASQIFFLISGFLLAYLTIPQMKRQYGKLNLVKYIAKRWVRFTPSLVYAILLVFLLPLFPNGGPMYKSSTNQLFESCQKHWWKNLFYLTNWYESDHICLPHTWFISVTFQLNLLGILTLFLNFKRPQMGALLSFSWIIFGIIGPAFNAYKENLLAISPIMNRPLLNEISSDIKLLHFLTFNHFSSYFTGLAMGILLSTTKSKFELSKIIRLMVWIVLPLISLASVIVTYNWNNWKKEPSITQSIAYYGLHRFFFTSGIAWVIHECVCKRARLINSFLSHKMFLPLSRLTYQIYLLNLIIIWFYYFTKIDLINYRDFQLICISIGLFVLTAIHSIFAYLVFEIPIINLFNYYSRDITNGKSIQFNNSLKSVTKLDGFIDKNAKQDLNNNEDCKTENFQKLSD